MLYMPVVGMMLAQKFKGRDRAETIKNLTEAAAVPFTGEEEKRDLLAAAARLRDFDDFHYELMLRTPVLEPDTFANI